MSATTDATPDAATSATTIAAVAATLRYLAGKGIGEPELSDWLAETAQTLDKATVESLRASGCPVCDESDCDEGCPLEHIRAEPDRVGSA